MNVVHPPLTADRFSPLSGNSFKTRDDVAKAVNDLFNPMIKGFASDGAAIKFDATGAHFPYSAIHFEGFARPLWGIVPLVYGGGKFDHWDLYREGLTNGCDPDHAAYWGKIGNVNQQQVELAALGFALALVPEHIWEPLSDKAKRDVEAFAVHGRNHEFADNNWKFFRILLDMGLETVGIAFDKQQHEQYLKELDDFYIADGWYRDGASQGTKKIEYYNAFAFHFYGLLYAKRYPDQERSKRYIERAKLFVNDFIHWFDETGAAVPYGRSLTYRFACGSLWAAFAYADQEALPWGVLKGLYLRHLRWWADKPVSRLDDGVLSVGYGYPNQFMSEAYNSANSPYWAMKAFIPLALPESHPFWASEELPMPKRPAVQPNKVIGMIASHTTPENTTLLVSGPVHPGQRHSPEKYCKFAYSTRYAFNVEGEPLLIEKGGFDSMIAFSDNGRHWRVREDCEEARICEETPALYSKWYPFNDVEVQTYLIAKGAWHIRVHVINSKRDVTTIEGGFSVPIATNNAEKTTETGDKLLLESEEDISGIIALSKQKIRKSVPQSNCNLMFSRCQVPQLSAEIPAGQETVLACAALAAPSNSDAAKEWNNPPTLPSADDLKKILESSKVIELYK